MEAIIYALGLWGFRVQGLSLELHRVKVIGINGLRFWGLTFGCGV